VILLDTNVWSALNRPAQNRTVCGWIENNASQIWLSTIVIGEIQAGIENPKAASKRTHLERWLGDIEIAYADRILPFDRQSAHIFGGLIARRKLEKQETKLLDVQIAAQAIAHNCPVATGNVRDFEWTGVALINPWDN
jgi:toxin FitB